MAGKKVRNKEEEMSARQKAEKATSIEQFGKYLDKAKEARDAAANAYWQKGYHALKSVADKAYKDLKDAMAETNNIYDLEAAAPFTTAVNAWKKAVKELDVFCSPNKRDAYGLAEFINKYGGSDCLFKKDLHTSADWNDKKGIVELSKVK